MTPDPGRVQAVFLAAVEVRTNADRAAVLDRECGTDDELRRRVEALLIAHDKPDSLLDRPLIVSGEEVAAMRRQPRDTDNGLERPPSGEDLDP